MKNKYQKASIEEVLARNGVGTLEEEIKRGQRDPQEIEQIIADLKSES